MSNTQTLIYYSFSDQRRVDQCNNTYPQNFRILCLIYRCFHLTGSDFAFDKIKFFFFMDDARGF